MADEVSVFLSGDVMMGRGIDQILPHPGDPTLYERFVDDARTYVSLAERRNGSIPAPVDFAWPWGEALDALGDAAPDLRIINLETSITTVDTFAPGKGIHYRMTPANLPAVTVAQPDVCVLANNHVLDLGPAGLDETLATLAHTGLPSAGAGRGNDEAARPATIAVRGGRRRVQIHAAAMPSSGVPPEWAATPDAPGVNYLADASPRRVEQLLTRIEDHRQPGDLVIVSIHWGSNWGYEVAQEQSRLAHQLIDGGVDVVHGHSSHHPRPIEVYRERLILYGCGDLINDYEGISGHEAFRSDLRLLYLASLDADTGQVTGLRMLPMQARRMRLERAPRSQAAWLASLLDDLSRPLGAPISLGTDPEPHLRLTR
ncbi:MAG: CapA family protein [Nitriliruptoraceae bacterium]